MNTIELKSMNVKDLVAVSLTVLLTAFLVLFSFYTSDVVLSDRLSAAMNKQLFYQPVTLIITLLFLSILAFLYRDKFKTYLKIGNLRAKVNPEPYVGIKPKANESWLNIGLNFLVVISLATGVIIYFQLIGDQSFKFSSLLKNLPTVLLFALCNAFVEESITRIAPVVIFKDKISDKHIAILSGVLFGIAHFWGNPGGPLGMLFAGFLGWLLAKSVLETKGVFWALLIHFVQDIIIISAYMVLA
jgi:membrane protease YdiL (CAAX protease family)